MFLSREIDKKNCVKFIQKSVYTKFCIKLVCLDHIHQIGSQSENDDIAEEPK